MYRRYHGKQYAIITVPVVMVVMSLALAVFLATGERNIVGMLPLLVAIVLGVGTVIILLTLALVWYQDKKKHDQLRALTIANIDQMTGVDFERYVGEILRTQGYSISYTSASHDYGVDIVAQKDGIKYGVQLKRYTFAVGRAAISDVVAGMAYYKCQKGIVVTNNYFTPEAKQLAAVNNCLLVDRDKLSAWILEFQNKNSSQRELKNTPQSLSTS